MKRSYYIIAFVLLISGCKQKNNESTEVLIDGPTPKELLQKTMEAHGGENHFKTSLINFKIDNTAFNLQYDNNGRANFKQVREVKTAIHSLSYESGLIEYHINDSLQPQESYSQRMAEISLFGFLYTFSIPFNLTTNDVILSREPNVVIRRKDYYTLDVQFTKIPDIPEDHFLLYIDTETYEIKYIALQHDLSGSRAQFRRMIDSKRVDDILFQDYILFHAKDSLTTLDNMYENFNKSNLKVARTVKFDSIKVKKRE